MQSYLLSAAGVIFLSVIVSLLIPEGKLNKTITFVMRLICIIVLIQPVTGIFNISPTDADGNFFDSEYVSAQYSEHQSLQLGLLLEKEFGVKAECSVSVVYEEGQFKTDKVEVALIGADADFIEEIQAYLEKAGYINISVYEKST